MCLMDEGRLPRVMLHSEVDGQKPKDRPMVQWLDGVKLALSDKDTCLQGGNTAEHGSQSVENICEIFLDVILFSS